MISILQQGHTILLYVILFVTFFCIGSHKAIDSSIGFWSHSYKTCFGVITPFFGINYATFLGTNLSVEINAKILTAQNRFIGFKKLFILITPTPKF
jgi:hypothetical protein